MAGRKVSAEDHGAWVSIVTGVFMTYTLFFLLARMLMRLTINGPFLKDDALATIATVFATIQSALKLSETESGFGKRRQNVSSSSVAEINRMEYASELFYLIALTLSKIAACALIERLSRQRNHLIATRLGYSIAAAWGVASIIAVAVQCPGTVPWKQRVTECPDLYNRWLWIEIVGILVEAYLFWLPIYLVWGLHMSRQSKVIVVVAFSFRLPVIITSALRIHYLHTLFAHGDPIFHGVRASVCMEAELHYSLIASTIPCLKPFIKSFNTGYLSHRAEQTVFGSTTHSNSYPLTTLSSQRDKDGAESQMRSAVCAGRDSIGSPEEDGYDSGTNGSDKMIIKCTRTWDVSYTVAPRT